MIAQEEFPQSIMLWIQDLSGDDGEKNGNSSNMNIDRDKERRSSKEMDLSPKDQEQQVCKENKC